MEESETKTKNDEGRSLFKNCFKNPMFSLVPFEIWRDLIVSNVDLKAITLLSQTCHAFKEIVDTIGENNFNLALCLRKDGQIALAKKYLVGCAEKGNPEALFHIGYAHLQGGWGFEPDSKNCTLWLQKAAESGSAAGMAFYADRFSSGRPEKNVVACDYWGKKAISTNDPLAVGYCYFGSLGIQGNSVKSKMIFEESAKQGNEFGQELLGWCCYHGYGDDEDYDACLKWYLKAAKKGLAEAQHKAGKCYAEAYGTNRDSDCAIYWFQKAANQGHVEARKSLMALRARLEKMKDLE